MSVDPLHAEIAACVTGQPPSRSTVDALALRLYAWQIEHNPTYAAIAAGARPRGVAEIPPVPVPLFQELILASFPAHKAEKIFLTSGTTGSRRGRHYQYNTLLYDEAAPLAFRRRVGPSPQRICSLCPSEPQSSLGHMIARLGSPVWQGFDSQNGVSPETWAVLSRGPVFLAATAFALDALLGIDGGVELDVSSLVMVTGGFKGRQVRLDSEALYAELPARFGAPRVVGEYGMTELSSQLWTEPVRAGARPGPFVAPPWLRVYAADPVSGEPTEGVGVLRFVDLLNVWSVLAIETLDLGEVEAHPGGDRVVLHGRAAGADSRGCSLRAEDFLRRVPTE